MIKQLLCLLCLFLASSCHEHERLDGEQIKSDLDSMLVLDQMYRDTLMQLYQLHGYESEEFQRILLLQQEIDSSNLGYVEELIARYGAYPGKSLVGNASKDAAFFILQHGPDSIQQKYLDLILEAAEAGELDKASAAMFQDRYLIGLGEPQMYGTQVGRKEVTDSLTSLTREITFVYPIRDTTRIDSLRMWNGLPPLEDYLNGFGLSRWE